MEGMGNDPSALFFAVGMVLVLALVLRWVFKPSRKGPIVRPVDAAESPNLGLLTVVEAALTRQEALERRARLQDAGIRSSMSKRRDGLLDVLVFHGDANAARQLLGS